MGLDLWETECVAAISENICVEMNGQLFPFLCLFMKKKGKQYDEWPLADRCMMFIILFGVFF